MNARTEGDIANSQSSMQSMLESEKEEVLKEFDANASGSEMIKAIYRTILDRYIESRMKLFVEANMIRMIEDDMQFCYTRNEYSASRGSGNRSSATSNRLRTAQELIDDCCTVNDDNANHA